jgi:hypothetical protein
MCGSQALMKRLALLLSYTSGRRQYQIVVGSLVHVLPVGWRGASAEPEEKWFFKGESSEFFRRRGSNDKRPWGPWLASRLSSLVKPGLFCTAGLLVLAVSFFALSLPGAFHKNTGTWENSLGMKFVEVGGLKVSIWETRECDFDRFLEETLDPAGALSLRDRFPRNGSKHPITSTRWEEAIQFCRWLTLRDQKKGLIGMDEVYRLPTAAEWHTLLEEDSKFRSTFPGRTLSSLFRNGGPGENTSGNLKGRETDHAGPAPVGKVHSTLIADLAGNVSEWCMDAVALNPGCRIVAGKSWKDAAADLTPAKTGIGFVDHRAADRGFRCVLAAR